MNRLLGFLGWSARESSADDFRRGGYRGDDGWGGGQWWRAVVVAAVSSSGLLTLTLALTLALTLILTLALTDPDLHPNTNPEVLLHDHPPEKGETNRTFGSFASATSSAPYLVFHGQQQQQLASVMEPCHLNSVVSG